MDHTSNPTRCAFIVCRILKCGTPHLLFVHDAVWDDLTLVGGHEEPEDNHDLERTALRETKEELGEFLDPFELIPLTGEIEYGPTWSESACQMKCYIFKYYGIKFANRPKIGILANDKGFELKFVEQQKIGKEGKLSNVVKILLDVAGVKLDEIPLSWIEESSERKVSLTNGHPK